MDGAGIGAGSSRYETWMEPGSERDGAAMKHGWSRDRSGMEPLSNMDGAGIGAGSSRCETWMEPGSERDGAGIEVLSLLTAENVGVIQPCSG
ncbi:uncharacterized protein AAGF69_003137 isoform 3-T3 [Amazona ochrocephala]